MNRYLAITDVYAREIRFQRESYNRSRSFGGR